MTTWQWLVVVTLCKVVLRLLGPIDRTKLDLEASQEIQILEEAIWRTE